MIECYILNGTFFGVFVFRLFISFLFFLFSSVSLPKSNILRTKISINQNESQENQEIVEYFELRRANRKKTECFTNTDQQQKTPKESVLCKHKCTVHELQSTLTLRERASDRKIPNNAQNNDETSRKRSFAQTREIHTHTVQFTAIIVQYRSVLPTHSVLFYSMNVLVTNFSSNKSAWTSARL